VIFGAHELARVLPDYLAAYPEVDVEFTVADRLVDLIDEGYDAVFRTGHLADSSLIARPLRAMGFILCAAPAYIEARGAPKTPMEVRDHECLGFASGATRDRWSFGGPDGTMDVEVSCRFVANKGQVLLTLALAGLGLLLQPSALVWDAIEDGRLVRLLPGYEASGRPMHLLYAPDRRITPKLRSFIDFAVEQFGPPS
jgi:DNA-binding transcriptional LysR family regulator